MPFSTYFLTTFGYLLGSLLGPRSAMDMPKQPTGCHQDLRCRERLHFSKPWKTISFARFGDTRGIPRRPREAEECSQEAAEEVSKTDPKVARKRARKHDLNKWPPTNKFLVLPPIALKDAWVAQSGPTQPGRNTFWELPCRRPWDSLVFYIYIYIYIYMSELEGSV
jgi:hypothetical protein